MKRLLQATLVLGFASSPAAAAELTVLTAGDQNMVDYINEYLGPLFEKENPGNTVRVVGTGPGDAGSQKIVERFEAQKKANVAKWDADIAVAHEKFIGPMITGGYLEAYRDKIPTGKMVTRANADMALGTKVTGYVMPMFNSQTAIAYNPALIANPPKSYAELAAWAKANPKQFGYNGIKGGASGVSFVMGWVYAFGDGDAGKLMNGPFDEAETKKWDKAFTSLRDFTKNATLTPGNAGTLDLLSRGEIAMGPVWVDMFYSWQASGQLPPTFKLVLPAPGMPGQPMHYVIPAKSPNKELAEKFVALATSPKVQAEGIVKRFNWYPGIDAQHVKAELDDATWNKLFTDVKPEDLANYGKPFPIAPYNNAILEAYERQATN
ncbi:MULTISPECIES: extracellular solute-binding protein [unclassified Chelatococcus]|uniref:ABC transporter substrate-binding protein n=1 Tax=unclassified Chelatococcus TaxID=2638111 RepID=UPI001BD157A4|nr:MULTISPECIES: extracellular solute-binding protein [unclassified Chelatococcus]CAH1651187.1 ABC transporter substrate-binding protein [Hyphomicrobiales bacterium]MBS7743206.1 extracellular solute-binding protein [Chelatococcus sp. HY11]MBX3541676.1 extracellular solute-binding protein [Chelatococcus sp.]MCO5074432.1 extracellular solute-binding protein [Chelatococcus sp.]CAH1693083.1 ABC transporter substrate-binding protein [Hyphomicrobiales bacterium]